jgi:hypothetical protein
MSVFARGGPANRQAAVSPIVRSVLGTNALRPHAAWAAGAPQIRGGTSLESSRQRKARAAGAIVRSLPGCRLTISRLLFLARADADRGLRPGAPSLKAPPHVARNAASASSRLSATPPLGGTKRGLTLTTRLGFADRLRSYHAGIGRIALIR